jgi:nitrate/TMAO reductase-like tetraheme cytochrome c subunit
VGKYASMQVCKYASGQVGKFAGLQVGRWASWVLIVVVSVVGLAVMVGCSQPSTQELVEERCVGCHALTIVETSQKTRQEWEETVDRMVAKGARLNDQQVEEVIDYLSETYGAEAP